MSEAGARSGTVRYGNAYIGRVVTEFLGGAGAAILTAATVGARKLEVANMYLVVNKAPPAYDAVAVRGQVESAYKVPVAAYIHQSDEMLQLGSAALFCLRYSDHPYTQQVGAIAAQIMGVNGSGDLRRPRS